MIRCIEKSDLNTVYTFCIKNSELLRIIMFLYVQILYLNYNVYKNLFIIIDIINIFFYLFAVSIYILKLKPVFYVKYVYREPLHH